MMWKSAKVAMLEERLAQLDARLASVATERDYWKARAEKLLDMALFKREEITAPVFVEKKAVQSPHPMLQVLGAMTTMETDSRKLASTAAPVTPMK